MNAEMEKCFRKTFGSVDSPQDSRDKAAFEAGVRALFAEIDRLALESAAAEGDSKANPWDIRDAVTELKERFGME